MRSSKRPVHALHRYRCRWAWVSSKPSRTTVPLPHAGQWTPSGQRCWRTRAKHLASSISAERLTRSGTAIFEGPHAGWPARAVLADYHRGPAGTLPRPPPTTPEPNKSHPAYGAVRLNVGKLRELGHLVGWDPLPDNPHHGAVWGINSPTRRKRI